MKSVTEILSDVLAVKKKDINIDSTFEDDLGADSLDMVEITMRLEDEYDVVIDDDRAEGIKTVGDCVGYLRDLGVSEELLRSRSCK